MRIVQLANFYGPRSGGLKTALHHLGAGYVDRGHEVVLVVPGKYGSEEVLPNGVLRITLPALTIPATGGYRAVDPRRVADVLRGLRIDALEVSDRLTLRGFGRWAARRDISSVVISHERLDRLLGQMMPRGAASRLADVANRRMAQNFDTVVCTTAFAQAEFDRIGAGNVVQVPLGVDLQAFHPGLFDEGLRSTMADPSQALLVHCGRLSVEKRVEHSIDAVAALLARGQDVRLVIAGDGPRRASLVRRANGLPVHFTGFIGDRGRLAPLLATADVCLAPGPHETFGLAALEALAAGTPVVASRSSALAGLVTGACGAVADNHGSSFADAVGEVLDIAPTVRRSAARGRAEGFGWPTSVNGMLGALCG